jgi:hypothetical protein
MRKNLLLLFYITLFAHSNSNSQTDLIKNITIQKTELKIKKFQDPVFAKAKFFEILSTNPNLPDSINYSIYNEIGVCYAMIQNFDSAIYFTNKSIELVPKVETEPINKNLIILVKTLGNMYSFNNNAKSADSCFKDALQMCDKLQNSTNVKILVLGDYSTHFYNLNNYVTSLKLLSEAIKLNQLGPKIDSNKTVLLKEKMANIYFETHNYNFAEKLYLDNIAFLQSGNHSQQLANNYTGLAATYQHKNNIKESNNYFSKALTLYTQVNNESYQNYCLMKLAENQLLTNQAAKGAPMIKKAFDQMSATNSPFLTEAAPIYLKILHATNNVTEAKAIMKNEHLIKSLESNFTEYALAYYNATLPFLSTNPNELNNTLKRIILVSDSVHNQANRKDILEIEAKYQLTINEEKEALLKAENKILAQSINLKNIQLAIYLIAGILLLTFFFYSIKKYKQRITQHKQEINIKNVENEKLLLDADKYSQEMLKMQDIIETQKNNLLLHIEQMQSLEKQIDLAAENNLYQEKNVLIKQLEKLKTGNKHIELFMAKFNTIFPKFSTRLLSKYPKLTNSDIMFCCLLRMNLTPKEIASILNIEQQSFYKRKYRLAEKIELADIEKFNELIFSI